ncbi:MAG: molybdopterin-dependent oxidoreductase, partial [Chloroflexota bacterium]
MKEPRLRLATLLGAITSLPAMALFYLGQQLIGLPFVPFDLFDWLARVLPGDVITLGIDAIVRLINLLNLGPTSEAAKRIEQLQAIGLFVLLGAAAGVIIAWLLRRGRRPADRVGAVVGLVMAAFFTLIELNLSQASPSPLLLPWLAILPIGWCGLLGHWLAKGSGPEMSDEGRAIRRALLLKLAGGSAGVALGAWGIGRLVGAAAEETGASQPLAEIVPTPVATTPPTPIPQVTATATMRDRVQPAPGTRLELTPNNEFYRIDINTRPVVLNGDSWVLEVAGLFDKARPLTLTDLMAYPAVTQTITLSCISNRVGGDLIGTSNWTGVRLRDLVKDLGLRPEARELFIRAADGFYESVTMEDIMDPRTLLVYGMNGETLPVEHGFPLRIYIPNRYGMKQPKWITYIEAIDEKGEGYWVERGWSQEARPQIVSVIDTVAQDNAQNGLIPVGGIAWAGDRGIQKVEVQVNEGSWSEAVLRNP